MRALALIVLFGTLFLFCLGTIDLLDYDEACYAEVSREMYQMKSVLSAEKHEFP